MTPKRQSIFGDIAAAFMLLSRFPVSYQFAADSPPDFIRSLWAFPLVGLVIGGFGGIILALSTALNLPPFVCGALCVGVMAFASGAMHEDGLADTADGFGGGRTADDKMRIMHDSHIGSYGVLALCLSTVIRISLFAAIAAADFLSWELICLVAAIAAGARWQVLIALKAFPIAAGAKLSKITGRPAFIAMLFSASIWLLPFVSLTTISAAAISGGAIIIGSLMLGRLAMRQIEGISGDVMGAMIILAEIILTTGLFLTIIAPPSIGFAG
jgi:adenosylcobinamide-GDP ribazoletransferase